MFWAIAIVLGSLWLLAMISPYTFGGFIHLFVVAAMALVAYQMVKNRRDNRFKKGV